LIVESLLLVAEQIRRLPVEFKQPGIRYFAASGFLISEFVGDEILTRREHPFMRKRQSAPGEGEWEYPARLVQLAEFLFELRSDPGFAEICLRLREMDLVSAYFELAAAAKFKLHDFVIHARRPRKKKGEDFDFSATRGECVVNAEVAALRPPKFSRENVVNALGHKRGQLPPTAPAVIDCFWPVEDWAGQVDDIEEELASIAEAFFRGSRRINYLFFSREEFLPCPGGGVVLVSSQVYRHPDPRHRSDEFDEAMARGPRNVDAIRARLAESSTVSAGGFSDYYRWVDAILN
jgi:hypothetical protein